MKLYEFGPTRSIRARWMLQELGVDFEAISVDLTRREHRNPGFLELNPAGKVPVLIDDGLVLNESVAIVLYLAEKYPDRGFIPADLKLRPVWHQRGDRVEAHLLVCFLAYVLRKTLEGWSERAGLGHSPGKLLEEFARNLGSRLQQGG